MPTNPWDRRGDEPEDGYAAFLTYRDMVAPRSLVGAFRQRSGKDRAKQADGHWNRWSRKFDWDGRALAWDHHRSGLRQEGIDRAARDEAEEWERRRQQQARDDYDLGRQFLKQARTLAAFPVTDQVVHKDGKATTIKAIDPRQLKEAAAIAQVGRQMAWDAIREALPPDDEDDFDPIAATPDQKRAYVEAQLRRRKPRTA